MIYLQILSEVLLMWLFFIILAAAVLLLMYKPKLQIFKKIPKLKQSLSKRFIKKRPSFIHVSGLPIPKNKRFFIRFQESKLIIEYKGSTVDIIYYNSIDYVSSIPIYKISTDDSDVAIPYSLASSRKIQHHKKYRKKLKGNLIRIIFYDERKVLKEYEFMAKESIARTLKPKGVSFHQKIVKIV